MQEARRATADSKGERCSRCLQPVPAKAARCPHCRVPVQKSSSLLGVILGVAGLIVLLFAIALMYQTARNEDADTEEVPAGEVR